MTDRNLVFGLCLTIFGAVLGFGAYVLIANVPLTAMGIGLVVLGVAWALTPPHPLPRDAVLSLVKSSCSNIEALLEGLGAVEKAVYLPLKDGRVVAYVPIRKGEELALSEVAEHAGRLVVRAGGNLGVLLIPPKVGLESSNPTGGGQSSDLSGLLEYALVDSEVAVSVRVVVEDDVVLVEIDKPRVDVDYARFRIVMGSLPSSIAAQAVASAFSKPVQVVEEKRAGNRLTVRLRVLEWTDKPYT